jgi:hypothetical protein
MATNPIASAVNQAKTQQQQEQEQLRQKYTEILKKVARQGNHALTDDEVSTLNQVMRIAGFDYEDVMHHVDLLSRCHGQQGVVEKLKKQEQNAPDTKPLRREIDEQIGPEIKRLQDRKVYLENQITDAANAVRNRQAAENRQSILDQQFEAALAPITRS